jgi:hypothetical protein
MSTNIPFISDGLPVYPDSPATFTFLQRLLRQCFPKYFCGAGLLRKLGKDAQTHEALMGKQFEVFFSNYVRLIL